MSPAGRGISNVGMQVVRDGWWSAVRAVSSVADTRWGWHLTGPAGGGLIR